MIKKYFKARKFSIQNKFRMFEYRHGHCRVIGFDWLSGKIQIHVFDSVNNIRFDSLCDLSDLDRR